MVINFNTITEKELKSLNEDILRKRVIKPLLDNIGCDYVMDNCGQNECGVDIFFEKKDIFGHTRYFGIQCKKGDIKKTTSENPKSIITICNQIKEAFKTEFISSEYTEVFINGFYIITSGLVNRFAQEYIMKMKKDFPYLDIIDGQQLIQILKKVNTLKYLNSINEI